MEEPKCPKCGSPMVLRTARKGQNAGGKFYGCSKYPFCKGTLPFDYSGSGDSNNKEEESNRNTAPGLNFPHILIARSKWQGYQVHFFESAAVSPDILEKINNDFENDDIKTYAQWRLDSPEPIKPVTWNERTKQIYSVAEKILTRGQVTLCSPYLEKELISLLALELDLNGVTLPQKLIEFNSGVIKDIWLDSPVEKYFYEIILPKLLGPGYSKWVHPQVELSSLLPLQTEVGLNGRVDFLICHPLILKPIIVEIDGEKHQQHEQADNQRDELLRKNGYIVFRVPALEIQSEQGNGYDEITAALKINNTGQEVSTRENSLFQFISAIKIAHQIQLVVLQAIKTGFLDFMESGLWRISTDLNQIGLFSDDQAFAIIRLAMNDLLEMLHNLAKLYSFDICQGNPQVTLKPFTTIEGNSLHLSFCNITPLNQPTFYIQNIFLPFSIANEVTPTTGAVLDKPDEQTLEYFLNYIFRKPKFWEGQYDAVSRALQGKDAIVLLPTGAGKSIAFQLASLLLPGRAIVIDPIISLIEDQIDNLATYGITRVIGITSQITDSEDRTRAINLFGAGEYLIAYIAPERFQTVEFRKSLRTLTVHTPIALIAIDEAHCVSEWGHDFRTAYLNIGRISRIYCESNGFVPPLLALTGTASRAVLKDVQRELQIEDFNAIITPKSFDRPELKFHVIVSSSAEKFTRLKGYMGQMLPNLFSTSQATFYQSRGKNTFSGLVFCPNVNGDFGVVEVSNRVQTELGIPTSFYSGKQPKYWSQINWSQAKQSVARQFKNNQIPVLVSTKAYGMGIDKSNIRYTIHFGIPGSIESFYQEAGRAGRDRRVAHCCVLVSNDNNQRTQTLLSPNTNIEDISKAIKDTKWADNDDITRALFFHTNAFRGIPIEMQEVAEVLKALGDYSQKGTQVFTLSKLERNNIEKALHRLLILGILEDYTIDYSSNEFTVKVSGATKNDIIHSYGSYIAGYLESRRQAELEKIKKFSSLNYSGFTMKMVELLLNFIYEVIEKSRRRALYELLLATTSNPTDEAIRQRILRYLEATEYSDTLEVILAEKSIGIQKAKDIIGAIRSPNEAAELRGQVSRYLESYPDHPVLLMLRSLSEILSRDKDIEVAKQNFVAAISSAEEKFGLKGMELYKLITWGIMQISRSDAAFARHMADEMLQIYREPNFARLLIKELPINFVENPAWFLLNRLVRKLKIS